mgnify:CR=1 FL=1
MYRTFPVGAVKPSGWALDQAKIQADGLAGSLAEWYELSLRALNFWLTQLTTVTLSKCCQFYLDWRYGRVQRHGRGGAVLVVSAPCLW